MNIAKFLSGLLPKQLVGIYNLLVPSKPIQKFESRAVGEGRVLELIKKHGTYAEFFGDFATSVAELGAELPAPREPKVKEPAPEPAKKKTKTVSMPKPLPGGEVAQSDEPKVKPMKVSHKDYVNVRCPAAGCGYWAKTTEQFLELGRLKCPIHDVVMNTPAERGETRGKYQRSK
jgi:hypothetical protein